MRRTTVDQILSRHLSPRGVSRFWSEPRWKLADMSLEQLWDLGCFETIRLYVLRLTGEILTDTDSDDWVGVNCGSTLHEPTVSDAQDPQVSNGFVLSQSRLRDSFRDP